MSAKHPRPPREQHYFLYDRQGTRDVVLHVLERGERPGFDELVPVGVIRDEVAVCCRCGLMTVSYAHTVRAFGLIDDAMAIMRSTPPCDPLHTAAEVASL